MLSIRTEVTLAVLLAAGLLAVAFSANADAAGKYQTANFKAEVKGVQTYTSAYDHTATDRCDNGVHDLTKETVRFASTKPVKLTATQIPQVKGLVLTSGTKPLRFPTKATVTRSDEHSYTPVPDDCGVNGGGVEPGPGPDCGTKVVNPLWLSVDFYKRDHIELQPEDVAGSDLFERCGSGMFPYLLSGESFGKRQSAWLPPEDVFDEKIGQMITIGKGTNSIVNPEGYTDTKIRWDIRLTRIK
jgi:hypothetical protein